MRTKGVPSVKRVSVKEIVLLTGDGVEIGAKFTPDGVEVRLPNALELDAVADALSIFGAFLSGRAARSKDETDAPCTPAPSYQDMFMKSTASAY